jgi:hypothetical protein
MAQYEAGEWPVDYSLAECGPFAQVGEGELQAIAENAAVNLLWNWTQHQFGTTEVTLRPEAETQSSRPSTWEGRGPLQMSPWGGYQWRPVMINGHVYSLRGGSGPGETSAGKRYSMSLPGKVQDVLWIQFDDEVLDASEYRVDGDTVYLKTRFWPTTQNMRLDLGEPGTWGISYLKGIPIPKGGEIAAGVLACELAKAIIKDSTCRLPVKLQLLVSGGAGESIKDTYGQYLEFGKTGLWIIDSWVDSVLAHRERPTVRSVDLPNLR